MNIVIILFFVLFGMMIRISFDIYLAKIRREERKKYAAIYGKDSYEAKTGRPYYLDHDSDGVKKW